MNDRSSDVGALSAGSAGGTELLFQQIADSAPVLIWISREDGMCTWFNRPWLEFRGRTMDQELGVGWCDGVHPEDRERCVKTYKAQLEKRQPFQLEYRIGFHDGSFRWVLDRGQPRFGEKGIFLGFIGSCTDVTHMKWAEEALRESEKLAVVGRLAASIAHEINNPLEAVMNLLYIATCSADEVTRVSLDAAQQELMRISQITTQTLQFRRQRSTPEPVRVRTLLQSVMVLYKGRFKQTGVDVVCEESGDPVMVCYAGEIRQMLANFIGNALDAMPHGGALRIRVRSATDWRDGSAGLRMTVADTGCGMSIETRRRVYDPFFTTKESTGTGLGLWVSAGIAGKHHGSISVRSRETPGSSGTVFSVIFPERGASERG